MSSQQQGLLPKLRIGARLLRRGMNLWPPFVGARIHVTRIAEDFREVEVTMKLGLSKRHYFGMHFGGSLYAMTAAARPPRRKR